MTLSIWCFPWEESIIDLLGISSGLLSLGTTCWRYSISNRHPHVRQFLTTMKFLSRRHQVISFTLHRKNPVQVSGEEVLRVWYWDESDHVTAGQISQHNRCNNFHCIMLSGSLLPSIQATYRHSTYAPVSLRSELLSWYQYLLSFCLLRWFWPLWLSVPLFYQILTRWDKETASCDNCYCPLLYDWHFLERGCWMFDEDLQTCVVLISSRN